MTDTTKAQILEVARKAIHTEMLSLKRMEDTLGDEFATAVEMIFGSRGKCIVTGMGKSGLVGRKIAATLASTGTPSFFLHPGEAFHGDLGMISKEDIVVALSYSGETDEILKIVPFIHSNGNKLVSMTGNPDSALAKNSDVHLDEVGARCRMQASSFTPTSRCTSEFLASAESGFPERRFRAPAPGRKPRAASADDRRERHARPRSARRGARLPGCGDDPRHFEGRVGADRDLRG